MDLAAENRRQGGSRWRGGRYAYSWLAVRPRIRLVPVRAKNTPIQRHVKIKGEANPYDPAFETYFENREGDHMCETFRGTRTLRYIWNEQRGLCTVCNIPITRTTGWRLHHCVPLVQGGSKSADNRVLLHPACHDKVHRLNLSVSKLRLLKEAFEGPEPCDRETITHGS